MKLGDLCRKVAEDKNTSEWFGHIVIEVPGGTDYVAQEFIDLGLPVEIKGDYVIVGEE